jgi:heme exporter protein A
MQLTAHNLQCDRGGRTVFAGISFRVGAGDMLQLTGPNGSGKSSLLRLIAGLNEQIDGTLALDGGNADLTIGQQAHYIAHHEAVKAAMTVEENLVFWRDFLGGGDAGAAMAALDLNHLAPYHAGLLSAGQKRRLALARLALVPRPLWLLDEPTVGLDTASQARLASLMGRHLGKGGLIIAATHVALGLQAQAKLELGRPA